MKFSNVRAITLKNLNQIKRDPRMIALSVIAPIIITALFGSVFGGDLTNLEVYVVIEDENFPNIFSEEIVEKMEETQKIKFNTSESDILSAKAAVNNNFTQAAIIFPEEFTETTLLGKGSKVELYVSNLNPNTSNYIVNSFQVSLSEVMKNYFGEIQIDVLINYTYQGNLAPLPYQINVSLINTDIGWSKLHDKLSKKVYDILEEDDTVDIIKVKSIKKYEDDVKKGRVRGIILFPKEFTFDALINKEIKVKVRLDGAEPQACKAILGALSSSLSDAFEETYDRSAFEIDEYYYNNIDQTDEPVESITYFTPAIIGFIAFFFGFILTMLAFIRERKEGTMERILTSPLKRSEVIIGYIFSFSILSVIQSTITIIVAILFFNAQIEFSGIILLQAYLVIYLLLLSALGLGIFLSTLAKTEFQIIQFIPLVILPFMLLSGVWAPIESLPEPLRIVSSFIPLTYANNMMRDIFLRGETIMGLIMPISILAGFACLMIFLGIIKLNKTLQ